MLEHEALSKPQFGDFLCVLDYQDALNQVMAAEEAFDALPAKLRARFDNEPAKLLSFCEDSVNRDEMIQLGLIEPSKDPKGSGEAVPEAKVDGDKPE